MRDASVDRSSSQNMSPRSSLTLFYAEPSPGTYTMLIKAALSSSDNGILLENIAAITTVTCSGGSIVIDFADSTFATMARSWLAGTVLFTLSDSCNTNDERGVYIISRSGQLKARASDNGVQFAVTKSTLQQVVRELDISYGQMVSVSSGASMTSYTTTVTSYFTNSRANTLTSSIFVSTVTPSLTTMTYTSATASASDSSSVGISASSTNSVASPTVSGTLDPSAQAILNELTAGLPAPGPDGTISIPIKPKSDAAVPVEPVSIEPYNLDPAYQAKLQSAMEADGLDSAETILNDAVKGLGDAGESNVTPDSPAKLDDTPYEGTPDSVYDAAINTPVTITTYPRSAKRDIPASAASAPAPRAAAAVVPRDITRNQARHTLQKRDGWDTFFDVMGDDLVGEICELCGAM